MNHSLKNIYIFSFVIILIKGCGTPNPIGDGTVWGNIDSSEEIVEEDGIANKWSRSDLVKSVQEALDELGYLPGNLLGKETNQTQVAVKQYRIDHNLDINTVIDAKLEQHIDDLIWSTRNEQSIDPREVAKVIVQNRAEEYCSRKLGENYASSAITNPKDGTSNIFIYRIHTSEGAKPDYPASNILIDSKYVGTIDHNQHIKLTVKPGEIVLSEETSVQLDEQKKNKEYRFDAEAGNSYYFQLIVGKYDKVTHSSISQSAPFHIGGGVLDYLIGELVWDIMNSHKYGNTQETFYYADYISTKKHIGKCHIQLTSTSSDQIITNIDSKASNTHIHGQKVYSNLPLYGETNADNKLAVDTLNMITLFTKGQGCDAIDKVKSSIMQIPFEGENKNSTKERWVAHGCGKEYPFTVTFNEDGSGGTNFQVSKE